MIALKNVLVATDFSEPSDVALKYGEELATRFGAMLHVVHVAENLLLTAFAGHDYIAMAPAAQKELEDDARRRLGELLIDSDKSGPPTMPVVLTSNAPAPTIVDYARQHDIDVIVMGTHGRGALARLVMGSVAERVVRLAPCPVLTVRHPERDFVHTDSLAAVAHDNL
jgi:nucleotide-binding universal stress UspA family protein